MSCEHIFEISEQQETVNILTVSRVVTAVELGIGIKEGKNFVNQGSSLKEWMMIKMHWQRVSIFKNNCDAGIEVYMHLWQYELHYFEYTLTCIGWA